MIDPAGVRQGLIQGIQPLKVIIKIGLVPPRPETQVCRNMGQFFLDFFVSQIVRIHKFVQVRLNGHNANLAKNIAHIVYKTLVADYIKNQIILGRLWMQSLAENDNIVFVKKLKDIILGAGVIVV